MDSMGIRRHLEEEGEEDVFSTGSRKLLKACSYTAHTCASRISARAVWFSSDCFGSCLQFCMSFDTTDWAKLQELTKTQKMQEQY